MPTPTGGFASLSGITVRPSPATPAADAAPIFEDPTNTKMPQRIRFSFDVVFTDESAFPPGRLRRTAVLNVAAQIGGANLSGAAASLGFELLGGANPYFTNVDPANAADLAYLSQDLRVFSVIAGQTPLAGAPAFTSDAYGSIQNFIGCLNGQSHLHPAERGTDPLDNLPGQAGFETADSSVTPTDGAGHTAYNFAIARVRLRGTALDQATNCRVFFRLFVAQSCDTDFQPSTTYKSTQGTSGADAAIRCFRWPRGVIADPSGQTLQTIPYLRHRHQRHP